MLYQILARLERAAPKDAEAYQWFTYTGTKLVIPRVKGSSIVLTKDSVFGVRKSSNGKQIRLVEPGKETIVYTLDTTTANKLGKNCISKKGAAKSNKTIPVKDSTSVKAQSICDKKIPKAWFKSNLEKNKNSFWLADKRNVPETDDDGNMIPLPKAKITKTVYRAMPAAALKAFNKNPITKSKGIYFTSDLGDALTWALSFGDEDTDGSVVLQYTGVLDPKFFGVPDQMDHPNHVAYKGPMDKSKFKVLCSLSQDFCKENL